MPRDSFLSPHRSDREAVNPNDWEVVQSVGLQTLDLAILVRVQASQPILINGLPLSGFVSRWHAFHPLLSAAMSFS